MAYNKLTHEEFVKKVFSLVGNEYTVIGTYINSQTPIKIRHNVCNTEYEVTPNNFMRGRRCRKCRIKELAKKQTKDTATFKKEVYELVKDEYTVLGEYVDAKTQIKMRHNKCNTVYNVTPDNFKRGKRCPECAKESRATKRRKPVEKFLSEVEAVGNGEYIVLSQYKNNNEKVKMKHIVCGYIWDVTPSNFLDKNSKCPYCSGLVKLDTETFKKRVKEKVGDEYSVLGEYINAKHPIKLRHNICGFVYDVAPTDFYRGNRCPKCSMSKGENFIHEYLKKHNIPHKRRYVFPDCKCKRPLPFDFAIFDKDNKLLMLIEFDGLQHFQPVDFFGGEIEYQKRKERDKIKDNYCLEKGIKLIRINYNENIKERLNSIFGKNNK